MRPTKGQRISFSYRGQPLEGTILNEETGKLVIKLNSGYNITVKPGELKDLAEQDVAPKRKRPEPKAPKAEGGARITLLHTGGTVASKVDYETGAVVAKYTAEEILALYPELSRLARMESRLIRNMMSDDMRFAHYNLIGEAVAAAIMEGAEGVIITHGTDTLHYTAAALGFMLENLPVPVVLVGSQRSSDRGSSDAATNLLAAVRFIIAAKGRGGVYTCLHGGMGDETFDIIDGFHSRKMHSSRRDAFRAVNVSPVATVERGQVRFHGPSRTEKGKLALHPFNEKLRIGMLFIHPNMAVREFEAYAEFDGLVILGTGLGHAPITAGDEETKSHAKNYEAIAALAKRMPVVMTTQTIYGRVNMNVYSPGRKLLEAGLLGQGLDMTPETAFIKLAWLLSAYDKKETRLLFGQDLRGELSERSDEKGFETV